MNRPRLPVGISPSPIFSAVRMLAVFPNSEFARLSMLPNSGPHQHSRQDLQQKTRLEREEIQR